MALYTTEDVGNISFQQPVAAPTAPSVIGAPSSAQGAGINAVADIVGALAPGVTKALANRNPLDDFAKDLEGSLKSIPATTRGAAQRERQIKQAWLDFSIKHPEYSDDAAAYTRNITGYDLTTPEPAVLVNNQMNDFFENNPSVALNAVVMKNGEVDNEATYSRRQEIYHREMQKQAKAQERARRLESLEQGNKIREEEVKFVIRDVVSGWQQDSQEKIAALESFISMAEGPQDALAGIREARTQAINQYRIEAAESGLLESEYKDELKEIETRWNQYETLITENLNDYSTVRSAIENNQMLETGEALSPVLGSLAYTPEGRKAAAEVAANASEGLIVKSMKLVSGSGLPEAASLNGWGIEGSPGKPDADTLNQYREGLSDLATGGPEGPGNAAKPSSRDMLTVNTQIGERIDINKPDGPRSFKEAVVGITTTAAALNKPMSQKSLNSVLTDGFLENLNRSSQLTDVNSQESVEAVVTMANDQMNLSVGAAESRLGSLPKGMGIVYENGQFRVDVTGRVSWGDKVAETDAETQGYVVVDNGKVTSIMGGPGVADVPSGKGVTVIPLKNTSDAAFVARELDKVNDTLKAANYLSKRLERVTGIKDEWRAGVDSNFERFAPAAPEAVAMPENIKLNTAMNPLVNSLEGASELTRPYAASRMNAVLSGPFQQLQEAFGKPLIINDAIAKSGTSREKNTPGSRHFHGDALDIDVSGMTDAEKLKLVDAALKAGFQGFGFGNSILHIDMGNPRAWNYNNDTFGGRPVDELIAGVRNNVGALPNLPMIDTGQQPTDEEELGMEADPREGRPTNYVEFPIPNRRTDEPEAMTEAPSAPPFSQQIANDSLREVPEQIDMRDPAREAPEQPQGEPQEQNQLARQVQEQQMNRALQALQKLGIDPSQIPAFNSVEDVQRAIDQGIIKEGDLYEINGEIEVVEEA